MRRTKIVATIGPASVKPEILRELIRYVDVFRLNFSHGTHDFHRETIALVRKTCEEVGREVALLQDLCGPKIRCGEILDGAQPLVEGAEVIVTNEEIVGTSERFTTQYHELPHDVEVGARILLDDGNLELEVLSKGENEARCKVIRGGTLKSKKGMNLPNTKVSVPSVTEKDLDDLQVGLAEDVDFVALSFVRHPDDIRKVIKIIKDAGKKARVIAKIEKPEAMAHIDEIIEATDGIMVARGDLGVEMDAAEVPFMQKSIIRKANGADRYVITATQMLESMINNAFPTRAEVGDVATAIIDGTDAVMLSGETAAGRYPLEAVKMMDRVAHKTEKYLAGVNRGWDWTRINPSSAVHDAMGNAALALSEDLDVKAIITFSPSGGTALYQSKSRPFSPIVAFTGRPDAFRRMRLFWGVEPVLDQAIHCKDDLMEKANNYVLEKGLAREGDRILLITGTDFDHVGANNIIEIKTVGSNVAGGNNVRGATEVVART